jgi:hypothetical protein
MSCSLTVEAVRERRKTVTRRAADSWTELQPGDRLTLVEKAMGLPKGAHHVVLAEVEIVSVRVEPVTKITRRDVRLEGFPGMSRAEFVDMWLAAQPRPRPVGRAIACRRIQWRYLD